jgi:Tfp pilus assembly protein PilZ
MPIALVANPEGERALIPASALDFSSGGLRIQTSVRLSVGELIHIQFVKDPSDLRQYQVVWTKPAGALRPSHAGLRFLKSACKTIPAPLPLPSLGPMLNAA